MSDLEDEVVEIVEEEDLEEGEITDSDEEVVVTKIAETKKLPKRYSLHESKVKKDKHKSNYSKAHHSDYKVKDRNKSPITNGTHKKHKSSCSQHQKYSKAIESSKTVSPTLDNRNFTSAFKNFSSPPRPVLPKTSPSSKPDFKCEDEDNYSELLLAYKKCRQHLKSKRKSKLLNYSESKPSSKISKKRSSYDYHSPSKSKKHYTPNKKTSPPRDDASIPFKENNGILRERSPSVEELPMPETAPVQANEESQIEEIEEVVVEQEESEDEEELRRIALATFAKRTFSKQKAENTISAINSPTHSISNHSSVELFSNVDSSNDNCNVVDMDLDEEDFVEDIHNNLFVIDNNPVASSEFNPYFYDESHANHSNSTAQNYLPSEQELCFPASFNQMNEDAQEAILRAEVIASMFKKKTAPAQIEDKTSKDEHLVQSNSVHGMVNKIPVISKGQLLRPSDVNTNVPMHTKNSPSPTDTIESLSPQEPFSKIPVLSNGHVLRPSKENINTEIAKLDPKLTNSKKVPAPRPRNINATQNRLIITLNNDSSTEESDDEISDSKQDNVMSSFDALISDARLRSDIKASSANLNNVSCLSKAQQEEYKKLRNLLAEKEPMTILPPVVKEKIAAEHQNLNFLTTKISLAKEKLDKEILVLQSAEREVVDKKKIYLSAKLKFQHLQEQLHAAKLSKAATLKAWKVHEAKLGNTKSSITKQKALIALLETEYNHRRLQFEQNSSSPLIQ
ncbi:hypothetical protein JTE90_006667 [Oedothorax gibbosus]|uniref:Uncharacterized protein n=1 Tax=Oedothorax gibbosus TaxID=931172 RepID=A0AAV6V3G1_9ARAC|nr:hypothetical protein JTE90_006667 [Oedothorax gibbosus]